MITFFIVLAVLMVLVVAAGQWTHAPRRRVYVDDDPIVVDRRATYVADDVPATRGRRIVRRTRVY